MSINYNFNMLVPEEVTASKMAYGPPDAENQLYSGNGPFSEGFQVWDAGGTFQSLINDNSEPLTDTNSWLPLGEVDDGLIAHNPLTEYFAADRVVSNGYIWESVPVDGNTGNTPFLGSAFWQRIRATNRYKSFDSYLQDATTSVDTVKYVLRPGTRVTHIAFFRLIGSTVRVQAGRIGQVIDYDETKDLIDQSGRVNLWAYLFTPIRTVNLEVFKGLPIYSDIEITITVSGASPAVGQICYGLPDSIGIVEVGGVLGIEDNSVRNVDAFGRIGIEERDYYETGDFPIWIRSEDANQIRNRFAERRAKATVYFMEDGAKFGQVIYGFFPSLEITLRDHILSKYFLQIEGLT